MNREAIYMSAIRDRDGTVNVGYLILFRMLRLLFVVVGFMCAMAAFAVYKEQTTVTVVAVLGALGTAIGIAAGGMFSTAIAAIAAFLWGDSRASAQSSITTRTESVSTPTVAIPAISSGIVEPLKPSIGPEDVGKNVAIVSPSTRSKK